MKYLFHLLLAMVFCIQACSPGKNEEARIIISRSAKARLDSTLKTFVDSGSVAGVSALIVEKDKEVYFNSFGFADREANLPMDRNTQVRIFSMTKPITGVALMSLYEKGAFQLDDPLSKYAPEFANTKVFTGHDAQGNMILIDPKRPITIRDITRHTAGFITSQPDTTSQLGKLVKKANPMALENTLTQFAEKLGSLPLTFHPGDQWAYGPCVDVQAFLVERLSGKPFEQYIKETIIGPLNMNTTRYFPNEGEPLTLAAAYIRTQDGSLKRAPDEEANHFNEKRWPLTPGGWGLTSTIDDYMRFARMLVNEGTFDGATLLKPETIKLMTTNHLDESVKERMWLPSKGQVGFGIDFAVRIKEPQSAEENTGTVGEFFWDGAASTLFWVDPENELTAVFFVQIFPYNGNLHKKFRDAVYGPYRAGTSN